MSESLRVPPSTTVIGLNAVGIGAIILLPALLLHAHGVAEGGIAVADLCFLGWCALGVPVWLMLSSDPDFRWQKNRSDSPWYPSMRIFRQKKFMDWSTVIDEMAAEFDRLKLKAA